MSDNNDMPTPLMIAITNEACVVPDGDEPVLPECIPGYDDELKAFEYHSGDVLGYPFVAIWQNPETRETLITCWNHAGNEDPDAPCHTIFWRGMANHQIAHMFADNAVLVQVANDLITLSQMMSNAAEAMANVGTRHIEHVNRTHKAMDLLMERHVMDPDPRRSGGYL